MITDLCNLPSTTYSVSDSKLLQIVKATIVYIKVNIPFNARQSAAVGMLPELPFPFIFDTIHIIMRNPIWISIKY